jgi:hypothetical protein
VPTISGRTVLAANGSVQNVLLGSQYELAPYDATIEIGLMASNTLASCAIFAGPDVLAEPGSLVPIPTGTLPIEATPVYPDNYHWEDQVAKGDRLKISLLAGTNACTINWALRITPS